MSKGVPERMIEGAELYKKKNSDYGNSWEDTGKIMAILFPKGIALNTEQDHTIYALLVRKIDKLKRVSNLSLGDAVAKIKEEKPSRTADDDGVYAFMLADFLEKIEEATEGSK